MYRKVTTLFLHILLSSFGYLLHKERKDRGRRKEGVVIVEGVLKPNKTTAKSVELFNIFSLRFFLANN
jgi:hypothetical protein